MPEKQDEVLEVNATAARYGPGRNACGGRDFRALRAARKRVPDCSRSGDGPNRPPMECFRRGGFAVHPTEHGFLKQSSAHSDGKRYGPIPSPCSV